MRGGKICHLVDTTLAAANANEVSPNSTFVNSTVGSALTGTGALIASGCTFGAVTLNAPGVGSKMTGCTVTSLATAQTEGVFTGNRNFVVTESGAADFNFYSNNEGFDGSTIIGADSVVENNNTRTVTTTPVTLDRNDKEVLVDSSGGNRVVNLPAAAAVKYHVYTIKKIDAANTVTIDASGAETIDGATTVVLSNDDDVITIISNGTAWFILSRGAMAGGAGSSEAGPFLFTADQLDNIVNADVPAGVGLAPAVDDSAHNAIPIRAHDDSTEEGVLFPAIIVPATGFTQLKITVWSKTASATSGVLVNVGRRFYERAAVGDSTALTAWSAAVALSDVVFPVGATSINFLKTEQTLTLAALGLVAANAHQIAMSRNPGVANDVVGDWRAWIYILEFLP